MMSMVFSDSECYTDSSDNEDHEEIESIYGGHAQSILSSLEESIGKIDNFLAFERGFLHGDIVCSESDPSGQMGRVVDVDIMVDLETMSGEVIKDVNSKNLLKVMYFMEGDFVVCGPWLGRVGRVVVLVAVLFDDGAKCEIMDADPENLLSVSPNLLEDAQCPYYPGQRVRSRHSAIFKTARWLCGAWKANRDEGTVCKVEVGSVYVNWIASVVAGSKFTLSTPPCRQDPKNLTLLSCFPYANWQLGDWCALQNPKKLGRGQFEMDPDYDRVYFIAKTKSKVDVLWQDGNISVGLDSKTLFPINNIGDHEFWPEQFVSENGTDDDGYDSNGKRVGVVKSVDAKERTVKVKWMIPVPNQMFDPNREFVEETVSVYELIAHSDYSYCLGDIVFRLFTHSESLEGSVPTLKTVGPNHDNEDPKATKKDMLSFPSLGEKGYLYYIGNVTGFKDGNIEVRWASGLLTKVGPHEIVGIDGDEDPSSTPLVFDGDSKDNNSQEMFEYEKHTWHKQEKDESASVGIGQECKKDPWDAGALLFPRAALGFLTNIATSIFGSRGSTSLSSMMHCSYSDSKSHIPDVKTVISKDENNRGLLQLEEDRLCNPATDGAEPVVDDLKVGTISEKNEEFPSPGDSRERFKKFDIVDDYSDHHFINDLGHGSRFPQTKRSWLKRVHQEWSILQKDLPDTIYVRVYEERIDLMRAAIVGAPGTPYHDGLFFFDVSFPMEYPNEPPLVHYNSGGLRLNPNLYESGRVCLSLLNTWTGTGSEVWNPTSSTILQVLVSLEALVLNEKPYFNEAGFDQQIGKAEGEKNSIAYNENAFILSLKSMLYLLRKPPKHFEALVEEHFRGHSHSILDACKRYMDGAQVGCIFGDGMVSGGGNNCSSAGFKIMLAKIFPKLVSAFTERGIDCNEFVDQENKGSGGTGKDLAKNPACL